MEKDCTRPKTVDLFLDPKRIRERDLFSRIYGHKIKPILYKNNAKPRLFSHKICTILPLIFVRFCLKYVFVYYCICILFDVVLYKVYVMHIYKNFICVFCWINWKGKKYCYISWNRPSPFMWFNVVIELTNSINQRTIRT